MSSRLLLLMRRKGGAAIVADSLVAEWRLDEGSGTDVADSTGNLNGMIFNAGAAATNPTWTSEGLTFDGGDYVWDTSPAAAVLLPGPSSFMVVCQVTNKAAVNGVYGQSTYPRILIDGAARPGIVRNSGNYRYWSSGGLISNNTYFCLTVSVPGPGQNDIASSEAYINTTKLTASETVSTNAPTNGVNIYFGRGAGSYLTGKASWAAMWSKVLSADEVEQNYLYVKSLLSGRGVTLP